MKADLKLFVFTFNAHEKRLKLPFPRHQHELFMTNLEDPDPGYEGCKFLQWIKKRGNIRSFRECKLKTQEIGFDIKPFMKRMHPDYIGIFKTGDGQTVISLNDIPWADRWMHLYDLEIPHHRHWKKLK